jgi:hypothetical protein
MQEQPLLPNSLPILLRILIVLVFVFGAPYLLNQFIVFTVASLQKYSIQNGILVRKFLFVTKFEIPVDSIKFIRTNRDKLLIGEIPRLEFFERGSLFGAPYVSITHVLENKKTVTTYAYTLSPQKLKAMIRNSLRS